MSGMIFSSEFKKTRGELSQIYLCDAFFSHLDIILYQSNHFKYQSLHSYKECMFFIKFSTLDNVFEHYLYYATSISSPKAYIAPSHILIELLLLIPRKKKGNLTFINWLDFPYLFATQWAAVITHCGEMMVPPQICFCLRFRDTWVANTLNGSKLMPWDPPKPGDWAYSEKETQISYS